jgi:formylglycine-generating enzyme required for sulfatase activity
MTAERLIEMGNAMNIVVLITDGKVECEGDLDKTAREIKEKYDYSIVFYIVGLDPEKGDRHRFRRVKKAGYGGGYKIIREKKDRKKDEEGEEGAGSIQPNTINKIVSSVLKTINNKAVHTPKIVNVDDMILIPSGEFMMGTDSQPSHPNEKPKHTVYLDAYYIDKYEVTQRQYKEVMGENPSIWIGSDMPVEAVSWFEAKEYCEKVGKRLPTEAEWEKAAKGGREDIWAGTNDEEKLGEYAWHNINAKRKTHPVGQKKPNGYGLYDMSGNVDEWVSDWYKGDYHKISPKKNPTGPEKGIQRVLKGGAWDNHWYGIRTTRRIAQDPDNKSSYFGFRCVKSAE